jgi:hypothetical protein
MADFTAGTIFTKPLAGNELLLRLRYFRFQAVFTEPLPGSGSLVPTALLRLLGVISQYINPASAKLNIRRKGN